MDPHDLLLLAAIVFSPVVGVLLGLLCILHANDDVLEQKG